MTPHSPTGRKERIALRRAEVMRLRVAGKSTREIVRLLPEGLQAKLTAVCRDIAAEVDEARKRAAAYADEVLHLDNVRAESMIAKLQADLEHADPYVRANAARVIDQLQNSRATRNGWTKPNTIGGTIGSGGASITFVLNRLPDPEPQPKQIESTIIEPAGLLTHAG